jgi:SAM-dependent methyltransferase
MVDWGAGEYEKTAAELEPVAQAVVELAELQPGDRVLDLACGTGNAALLAATRGAQVVGLDSAPRLLEVARQRAHSLGLGVDLREGDLLDLPVADASADVVVSVFGLIFASDPAQAMRELARVLAPSGRAYVTAWIPAGPIDAMLSAMGRILGRVTQARPPRRFPWSDAARVQELISAAGLTLDRATPATLAIRDRSPTAYVEAGQEHPMSLAARPALAAAGADVEARDAMIAVLRDANEDPDGFLVHSPYIVYELSAGEAEPPTN